jgi:hypothetical protein
MKWLLKNWFLLGLIALAICAIPGVILVVLSLFAADGDINKWLLDTWQITYELRVPPWIALVLLFLPIVLVILYFLKLKRKPIQVPSTFLWKKSIEDMHVNSLLQWLRHNVLLLLQLLVLLFLIYSVLGLRIHGSTEQSKHYILMIDNSASMSVKDVPPSRLTWAKLEALKEIAAANVHDYGMVIVFNSKATTLQTYTNDKEKLREAVASIQATQRPTRIEEALALADSLANPMRSTEDTSVQPTDVEEDQKRTFVQARGISTVVHIYSDGRFAKLSEAALTGLNLRMAGAEPGQGGLNLRYHMAGKITQSGNANNLAIVGLNVLRQPAAKKKTDAQQLLAFVRVANYRSEDAAVRLKLDVYVEGALTHPLQQGIKVQARKYVAAEGDKDEKDEPGEASVRFDLPPLDPRRHIALHAYLDKADDDFPLDDQAWLVVGTTRKAKVLVVGGSNKVLESFFEQDPTRKIAVTERMAPGDLKTEAYRKKARSGEFDLIVFDRCAPQEEADMPLANTFFIDRPPPPWKRGSAVMKNPLLMPSKLQHPLLRYLTTIMDVRTDEAFFFDVKKNLDPVAGAAFELPDTDPKKRPLPTIARIIESSNQAPILFTMPRGPFTDLVLTFPLMSDDGGLPSNWYEKPSFPLFFRNVLYILGNVDDSVRSVSVQPGEPVVLRPEAGFRFIELTTPAKQTLKLQRGDRHELVFSDTDSVGIYRYHVGAKDSDQDKDLEKEPMRGFAVNLLDANESNIEPRDSIRIGDERITAGEEKLQTREIWKWILLLAVVLLVTEWLIYQRRIAV